MEIVPPEPVSIKEVKHVYDNSTVHCAVVTDATNKIVFASQSLADALGYKLQELDGATFSITPAARQEPQLDNGLNIIAEDPSKKGYVIQKNGAKALVDFESVPLETASGGLFTLSRISNLEGYVQYNRLTACRETLESILDNLSSAIIVIAPDLSILTTNTTFLKTFELQATGTNPAILKNLNCSFWQNENVLYQFKNNYEQEQYDFDTELDWEKEIGDNKSFKIASRLIHKDEANTNHKILLIITDVTEEKANQTGRNQQIRHIMHELRNPLSNLALCVELLADSIKENNQEDAAVFLSKASNSVQRMKQLINDLNGAK